MISPLQTALREASIDWRPFLARPRLPSPPHKVLEKVRDASILITGAGGSIGSALSLRLAAFSPRNLLLLEASEQALYRLESDLASTGNRNGPIPVLGSVADKALLEELFRRHKPTLIFHAAAHKHVALLEEHPLAAISNNALCTNALSVFAQQHKAIRMVLLSTDKAVDPISILGATKRIAEQIALAHNGVVLRLCNVLGTEGSVVDTFQQQIASGEAITIAHHDADRYFITIEEAVDLLLFAAIVPQPASLLIPALQQPHKITTLAQFLLQYASQEQSLPFLLSGLRSGEKLHEKLWAKDEVRVECTTPGCIQIGYAPGDQQQLASHLLNLQASVERRDLLRALETIQALVPRYRASESIRSLTQQLACGVPLP